MSSRVAGAGLALIAAAMLAVSIATPVVLPAQLSLFAGHPTVNHHTRETQEVYVGLYGARLCNSGGDGTCKSGDAKPAFRIIGYAELGATGFLAASALTLALLTLQNSERRKHVARWVRFGTLPALAGAAALILLGPFQEASIPIGLGSWLHGAGAIGALLASVLAVRPPPPIKLRVGDRSSPPIATSPARPPFDMQALFGEAPAGPSDPNAGRRSWSDPVPPEAADAFDPPAATERPLFASAPQLRPLYDATPLQGGTGGLLPMDRSPMPAPPAPRASIDAAIEPPPSPLPPNTQVSLVPPMPDSGVPVALRDADRALPSVAPDAAGPLAHPGASPGWPAPGMPLATPWPGAETPLAPPPRPPPSPLRSRTDGLPPPRPRPESQSPRASLRAAVPGPVRAAVPMPARALPSPTRPPPIAPLRAVPPRSTISVPAPPPPAIPPLPRRADTDVVDPEGVTEPAPPADGDQAMSRVPIEIGDNTSQTDVGVPPIDDLEASQTGDEARVGRIVDTSPSGEPFGALHPPGDAPELEGAITSEPAPAASAATAVPPIAPGPPAPAPRGNDRAMPKLPISTAPDSLPPPKDTKVATGPSPACPQCEAPMAWVEEHLRFYCKSCRMYF